MALKDDTRLSLLPFPQRWDGTRLSVSVLLLPVGDPLNAPLFDSGAAFADTLPKLQLVIQPGTDDFEVGRVGNLSLEFTPTRAFNNPKRLFGALATQFSPEAPPTTPVARQDRAKRLKDIGNVYKVLPESYKKAVGFVEPRDPRYVLSEHDYACRMRNQEPVKKPAPEKKVSWGQVISYALKQPALARAMGLIYDFDTDFTGWDLPTLLAKGGWLYVGLAPSMADPATNWPAARTDCFAARIPPLDATARPVFASVLFPDSEVLTGIDANRIPEEALEYDDGFAGAVHVRQPTTADAVTESTDALPPGAEAGIQIGWDDEQVLAWVNRQLDNSRARGDTSLQLTHAPLGVAGYRVDVREHGGGNWQSLCGVVGDAALAGWSAHLDDTSGVAGEFSVNTPPQRPDSDAKNVLMTLPRYFAAWRGSSLVVGDRVTQLLAGRTPAPSPWSAQAIPPLRYGNTYDFRVRLVDLTGGGPGVNDEPINPAPAPTATWRFERHVPPKSMRIETDAAEAPSLLTLRRPLLAYPDFVFAGVDATTAVVDELAANLTAERSKAYGVGITDPDVTHAAITVQVLAPRGDAGGTLTRDGEYVELYTVLKELPARDGFPATSASFADDESGLAITIDYVACADIEASAGDLLAASAGQRLTLPTGRRVRLRIRPANLPVAPAISHFAADLRQIVAGQAVALGLAADLAVHQDESAPVKLLDAHVRETDRCVAMLLQPVDLLGQPSPDPMQLIADALDLEAEGMSLRGRPGRRVVFAATGALRHALADGNGKITFSTRDELYGHWLVAHRVRLERDWTWNGLADQGVIFERPAISPGGLAEAIGEVAVPFVVSAQATGGKDLQRNYTDIVLFDAILPADADPATGIGEPQKSTWQARALLRTGDDVSSKTCHIKLPIARPPRNLPAIAAVGIARPIVREPGADGNYASTPPMPKSLWIEFEEPLLVDRKRPDRGLKYFGRVLGYGPDPLITPPQSIPLFDKLPEPPLPVDAEWIRIVHPGQSADRAGYDAMVELIPAEAAAPGEGIRHWLLPLPPGVDADSAALFGFWTYELRIGYAGDHWTTARARFGRALRVTGVQHPAPEIVSTVYRSHGTLTHKKPKVDAPIFSHAAKLSLEAAVAQAHAPQPLATKAAGQATLSNLGALATTLAQNQVATAAGAGYLGAAITGKADISITDKDWIIEQVGGGDIIVQAPFAVSLVDGKPITYAIGYVASGRSKLPCRLPTQPLTHLWALLYTQIEQADAGGQRNLLLARKPMPFAGDLERVTVDPSQWFGRATFDRAAVELRLADFGLPADAPLSVLVVELLPNDLTRPASSATTETTPSEVPRSKARAMVMNGIPDPLGLQLGHQRILRTSPLTPVRDAC